MTNVTLFNVVGKSCNILFYINKMVDFIAVLIYGRRVVTVEASMADESENHGSLPTAANDVADDLVALMSRDLVFVMRFLGESQNLLQGHFQRFILGELSLAEITPETHPMIHAFAERHAILLRDFVFSGVSLSKQLRVEEVERLTNDPMIRVDVWDQLRSHIDMAKQQFRKQLPDFPAALEAWKAPGGTAQ